MQFIIIALVVMLLIIHVFTTLGHTKDYPEVYYAVATLFAIACSAGIVVLVLIWRPVEDVENFADNDSEESTAVAIESNPEPIIANDVFRENTDKLLKDLGLSSHEVALDVTTPYNYTQPEYDETIDQSIYQQLYSDRMTKLEDTLRNYIPTAEEELGLSSYESAFTLYQSSSASVILTKTYQIDGSEVNVQYIGTCGEDTPDGQIRVIVYKLGGSNG